MVELVVTPTPIQSGDAVPVARTGGPPDAMVDISVVALNPQTGTAYTLALVDAAHLVTMDNASANTLTIPPNASVDFPVGTGLTVGQKGAGTTTIQGDTGVTLNGVSAGGGAISAQWSTVLLVKAGTDTWEAWGSIGTVS